MALWIWYPESIIRLSHQKCHDLVVFEYTSVPNTVMIKLLLIYKNMTEIELLLQCNLWNLGSSVQWNLFKRDHLPLMFLVVSRGVRCACVMLVCVWRCYTLPLLRTASDLRKILSENFPKIWLGHKSFTSSSIRPFFVLSFCPVSSEQKHKLNHHIHTVHHQKLSVNQLFSDDIKQAEFR